IRYATVTGVQTCALPIYQVLPTGWMITGRTIDDATGPVASVNLDVINAFSGVKQFTPHDNTDDNGNYTVTVRAGTYDVTFDPPRSEERRVGNALLSTRFA